MGLALIAVVCGAAGGLLAGRRPPRRSGVPLPALAAALAGALCLTAGRGWLPAAAAGYALLLAAAALEWRRVGMVLVAAGLLANVAVIAADGGMPVKGLPPGAAAGPLHHGASAGDRLVALSDVIAVPVVSETVSPGDVALSLGGAVVMFFWLEPRRRLEAAR